MQQAAGARKNSVPRSPPRSSKRQPARLQRHLQSSLERPMLAFQRRSRPPKLIFRYAKSPTANTRLARAHRNEWASRLVRQPDLVGSLALVVEVSGGNHQIADPVFRASQKCGIILQRLYTFFIRTILYEHEAQILPKIRTI